MDVALDGGKDHVGTRRIVIAVLFHHVHTFFDHFRRGDEAGQKDFAFFKLDADLIQGGDELLVDDLQRSFGLERFLNRVFHAAYRAAKHHAADAHRAFFVKGEVGGGVKRQKFALQNLGVFRHKGV